MNNNKTKFFTTIAFCGASLFLGVFSAHATDGTGEDTSTSSSKIKTTQGSIQKIDILKDNGISEDNIKKLESADFGNSYLEWTLRLFEPFDYLKEEATIGANPYNVNQIISHKDAKEVLDAIFNIYQKANQHKEKVREGYEAFNEIGFILTHTVDDFSIQQLIEKSKTFK